MLYYFQGNNTGGAVIESNQYTIYIGLNDSETMEQKFTTDKYLSILKNVCRSYKVPFSVQKTNGGYFHEDGRYTEENSLILTMVNIPEDVIVEIAKDLCVFFNQESIVVTSSPTSVIYINEKL